MYPTPAEDAAPPPAAGATALAPVAAWSTGLFGCLDDRGNCCLTWFCPCITFGLVAEIVDRGLTSSGASAALYALLAMVTGCQLQWVYSCFYRTKMRAQYGLHESPCCDFCIHCLCEPCALCQEYRELRNRGFVMDIGWQANMERNAATMPPHMHPMG